MSFEEGTQASASVCTKSSIQALNTILPAILIDPSFPPTPYIIILKFPLQDDR
jgi:hypothetical protein